MASYIRLYCRCVNVLQSLKFTRQEVTLALHPTVSLCSLCVQVKFVTSPIWRGRGSVGGGDVRRSVLRVLPANAKNTKLLVGPGSSRLPSFGKNTKTPRPHEVVSCRVCCPVAMDSLMRCTDVA